MKNNITDNQLKLVTEKFSVLKEENEKRITELNIANKELILQHEEKDKCTAALTIANKELVSKYKEKESRVNKLEEILFWNSNKEKQHITRILNLANKIETGVNTPDDIKKEADSIKQSAQTLDEFTKEMTKLIENLLPPITEKGEHKNELAFQIME